ncbi:MAG: ComF family protein [Alphaproteobacteria bacterium]
MWPHFIPLLNFSSKIWAFCLQGAQLGLEFLLPHQCPCCLKRLERRGVCGTCWGRLRFITSPCCVRCGYPFSFEMAHEASLCGGCLKEAPPFSKALSVLAYNDVSKQLLFAFKRGRRLALVPLFSQWLVNRGASLFQGADLVVPVPLHWTRLWQRRFNQSAVLAKFVSEKTGIPSSPMALKRIRATPSQGLMARNQRFKNVEGAFQVSKKYKPSLKGKVVILLDDVHTTGATLNACAKILKKAGTKEIRVLTLTRTVRE